MQGLKSRVHCLTLQVLLPMAAEAVRGQHW